MRNRVLLLCIILAVSYVPNASADNSERQHGLNERIVMQTPTSGFSKPFRTGDTNEQWVCGWSVDRLTRGDDCAGKTDLQALRNDGSNVLYQQILLAINLRLRSKLRYAPLCRSQCHIL